MSWIASCGFILLTAFALHLRPPRREPMRPTLLRRCAVCGEVQGESEGAANGEEWWCARCACC